MQNQYHNMRKIYETLEDDLSKDIFVNRLMYSITNDYKYIINIVRMTEEGKDVYSRLANSTKKKVIFGSGIWGGNILRVYEDMHFECFIDNNASEKEKIYMGLPVISFQSFMEDYKDVDVVIASRLYHEDMYNQLVENGVEEDNIIDAGGVIDNMSKRQYFDLPSFKNKCSKEVFVDGGSFDGRTSAEFIKWCEGREGVVYAFEPDPSNVCKCRGLLEECCRDKYKVFESCLWDKDTELKLDAIANGSSKVSPEGAVDISAVKMDDVVSDVVSFIKLDVEGSEYRALLGASNIIKKYKPKLAISIYHKPEDILELPELILSLNESYRFYLRHYSIAASETVLYAVSD